MDSTLLLFDCLDQLQITVFLSILLLLDKKRVGVKIFLKTLVERIIKNTFLDYSCTSDGGDGLEWDYHFSFLFHFKWPNSFSLLFIVCVFSSLFFFFFFFQKRWAKISQKIIRKINWKKIIEKSLIFYLNIPLGFSYTNWTRPSLFN